MPSQMHKLTILLAANYLLAVTVAALFHDHGHGECDHKRCPVCKFLAQKPVTVEDVQEVTSTALDQELVSLVPVRPAIQVPLLWHSRAPPAIA